MEDPEDDGDSHHHAAASIDLSAPEPGASPSPLLAWDGHGSWMDGNRRSLTHTRLLLYKPSLSLYIYIDTCSMHANKTPSSKKSELHMIKPKLG
jgi:hypothetical protein